MGSKLPITEYLWYYEETHCASIWERGHASVMQSFATAQRMGVSAKTKQHLAPTAIRGLEVLSLPVVSLNEYIQKAVERNPLLDLDYDESAVAFDDIPDWEEPESPLVEDDSFALAAERRRIDYSTGHEPFDFDRVRDDLSETDSLQSYLRTQLPLLCLESDDQVHLCEAIIESIDDDGYLAESLTVVCSRVGCNAEEGEQMLARIQTLQPRGVGARDLKECLLLQIGCEDAAYELLERMFSTNMQDFAYNRASQLLRTYGIDRERLSELRAKIRGLDPRPGASFAPACAATYVVPDITVLQHSGRFAVDVTGEIGETLTLNQQYLTLLQEGRGDEDARAWLEGHRTDAQQVLKNISDRKKTLYRLGRFLLENQYDFFCFGEERIKPLTMQHTADVLGLNVSTISRAVQDKYMLTPWGTYPLRKFFCGSMTCVRSDRTESVSSFAVKKRIQDLIARENKQAPLSDASLTDLLNGEGIEIKRRTVAKYRESLGLQKQSQRRM